MRMNELGLRFLYKLKINPKHIKSVKTIDERENLNFEKSKRPPSRLVPTTMAVKQLIFCYEINPPLKADTKKQHFLQHKE